MLYVHEENASHACKFDIFSHRACFGIFGDKRERPSKFVTKEIRSFCAIASPPMRLVADLSSSCRRRLYAESHCSVRLVQFCEEIIGIHELATVCLSYGLEQHAFLLWRHAKWFFVSVA